MAKAGKRVAIYLRVSVSGQTVENQRLELQQAAAVRGWEIVAAYEDAGVSGAKGRDQRPGLDRALKDAVRRRFDVLAVWSVDRLGRSLVDLLGTLQELHGAKVDLFMLQQGIDTTTPGGKAMFGLMGVFAEFERSIIVARVNAGLARRREAGGTFGRPKVGADVEAAIRAKLAAGIGQGKTARELHVGVSVVQRVARVVALEKAEAA